MNIALCADDNYTLPCIVTIISIFENNKGENCQVYILTNSLKVQNSNLYKQVADMYNQNIQIINVDNDSFSKLKTYYRFTKAMYYRFLLPEVLRNEKTVLYLDCDIIVRKSLSDLFNMDISNYSCAVVEDQEADDIVHRNKIQYMGDYFNSGVMLLNLEYWRKNNISCKLVEFIAKNPERCIYPDQDALNILLENTVLFLPYSYNFQEKWNGNLSDVKISFLKHLNIKKALIDPIIVHYCATEKPWHIECKNSRKDEWISYASKQSIIKFYLTHKYSFLHRFTRTVYYWIYSLVKKY